jgi:hypothetical protein
MQRHGSKRTPAGKSPQLYSCLNCNLIVGIRDRIQGAQETMAQGQERRIRPHDENGPG